jgi:uncharacterized membrane protein YsdA (DUF1294 family)
MANMLFYYLIVINVVTFIVYGVDKLKAKQGSWRISEATLLILAVIGGSIGALLGMKIWHHKTMHKKFKYGLPLILLVQIALIYLILDC